MKRVFVDSSAFFALLVAEDEFHAEARGIFQRAREERRMLVTTNAILLETHALLLNRARNGRAHALAFLDAVDLGFALVERVTDEDERRAKALLHAHADKTYSLCDALSFVVMERSGLDEAVSFDDDFRSYGRFTILH